MATADESGAAPCAIRRLAPGEWAVVSGLAHRIWPVSYAGVLTEPQIANLLSRIYSEENLRSEWAGGHRFWAAYDDSEPVGYASAYREETTDPANAIIWLKKLYVLPEMQGRGIGQALMHAAVDALSPAREVRLLVNRDNLAAQHYYQRKGFALIGETPVQMGDFHFVDLVLGRGIERG